LPTSSPGREGADKGKLPFMEEDTYSTAQAAKIPECRSPQAIHSPSEKGSSRKLTSESQR
jgi:hypothetical protein